MKKDIPITKIHSYNVSVASDVGINAAVIFYNICYWVEENIENERNYIDGEYWTYNTVNAFKGLFPEMTYEQIRYALRKLEDNGYIKSASYNKDAMNRTKWYTVVDVKTWIGEIKPKGEGSEEGNGNNHRSNWGNSQIELGNSPDQYNNNIYNNIITDKYKADNNNTNKKHKVYSTDKSVEDKVYSPPTVETVKKGKKTYGELKELEIDMVKRAMKICLNKLDYGETSTQDVGEILLYYFDKYTEKTGKIHPILSDKTLEKVITEMVAEREDSESERYFNGVLEYEGIAETMIDEFFTNGLGQGTDYHITHFATHGVLLNLGFKATWNNLTEDLE